MFINLTQLLDHIILLTGIEFEYSQNFGNYKEWMEDITYLLSREHSNKVTKGVNNLFLSLKKPSNVLGWLELRSFLVIEGKMYFGEQELPTLLLILITIFQSIYLFYKVFFINNNNNNNNILFIGILCLFIICLLSLMRIAIAGRDFEKLQELQKRLIVEQKFFLRCNLSPKKVTNGKKTIANINKNERVSVDSSLNFKTFFLTHKDS